MHRYKTWNAAMPTSAPMAAVATGTTTKTMLQIATPSTRQCQLISWGYTLSVAQAGTIELIAANQAATVTAHVAAGVQPLDPNAPASLMTLGTTATGFTATGEGTAPTAVRVLDTDQVAAATGSTLIDWDYQWMPDERPIVAVGTFLRVRATMSTTTNMLCWVVWDE
jgi:hypothetical protein